MKRSEKWGRCPHTPAKGFHLLESYILGLQRLAALCWVQDRALLGVVCYE